MIWFGRRDPRGAVFIPILLPICVLILARTAVSAEPSAGCLFAGPPTDQGQRGCANDLLGFSKAALIQRVISIYSLNSVEIEFIGCNHVEFQTAQGDLVGEPHTYKVFYPLDKSLTRDDYIAPLTHEIAHVRQMESAGGYLPLLAKFEIKRVELEADYLAGVVFRSLSESVSMDQFQHNLILAGLYHDSRTEPHGTPEQRLRAFRYGHTQNTYRSGADIDRARAEFQRDTYGEVIEP